LRILADTIIVVVGDGPQGAAAGEHAMRTLSASSFALITLLTSLAAAQDDAMMEDPNAVVDGIAPYTARGITLPARTLRVDLGPSEQGINNSGTINGPFGSAYGLHFGQQRTRVGGGVDETFADGIATMGFGVSYGIIDALEVGANLMPIAIDTRYGFYTDNSSESGFGNITLYGRFAFLRTDTVQMGAQLTMSVPTGVEAFGLGVGLPVSINIGDRLRLETGVEMEMYLGDFGPDDSMISIDLPLAMTVGIGENLFVGGHVSFLLADLEDVYLVVPLGGHAGYSFRGGALDADITASFNYSIFGDQDLDSDTRYSEWTIGLGGTLFFSL
jgi:hypothetical protein